jgi:hypothetical protein
LYYTSESFNPQIYIRLIEMKPVSGADKLKTEREVKKQSWG